MKEKIYELADRIEKLKDKIFTEEATKQSFILPFFQILGYDVFNPLEFCPEYTADVGIKKKEKVDYVILVDNKPYILIEAKNCSEKLEKHGSQLFRYFGTTEAKFAILTNGVQYRFYTDLDAPNKMDDLPFFELDLENITESQLKYIEYFKKNNLDTEELLSYASEAKYVNLIKSNFTNLVNSPSPEFVKVMINDFYEGAKTQQVIEKFASIVKRGITAYVNDKLSATFNQSLVNDIKEEVVETVEKENKIITTITELEGYAIIKSMCKDVVDLSRIKYRDTESYFSILLDNNRTKWIARLYLNRSNKYLVLPAENKKEEKILIKSVDDLFFCQDKILESLTKLL